MIENVKRDVVHYAKLLYERFLVGAAGGNVSMCEDDKIIITASGISLRDTSINNLIIADRNGDIIQKPEGLKPSKEMLMHISIYNARRNLNSVIHIHPVYVTAYAVRNLTIPLLTASSMLKLINVPVVPYADPGSKDLSDHVGQCVKNADNCVKVVILEKHGLLSFSDDIDDCFNNAELAEETAKVSYVSSQLGGIHF